MTSIENIKSLDSLKEDYNKFLSYLDPIIRDVRPRTKILNTKLGRYKKQLNEIHSLPECEQHKLIEIINKYTTLNYLIDGSYDITFKKPDLFKIVEGQFSLDDKDQEYNDTFLELSMALRFAKSHGANASINMSTLCDVIVGSEIAIECKYLHGKDRFEENISKAISQIDERIANGLATCGIVAIDISNIIEEEKISEFSKTIFCEFLLDQKRANSKDEDPLQSVTTNRNFSTIIKMYISQKCEVAFYERLKADLVKEKMNSHTKAIVFQATCSLSFSDGRLTTIVPIRSLNYFINPKLSEEEKTATAKLIHNLCTGI